VGKRIKRFFIFYFLGQFCGKEDKEKFEIDLKGSGSGTESNFGGGSLGQEDSMMASCLAQSPSNTNLDNATQALLQVYKKNSQILFTESFCDFPHCTL